jgi:hypothetical protein
LIAGDLLFYGRQRRLGDKAEQCVVGLKRHRALGEVAMQLWHETPRGFHLSKLLL